MQVNFRISSIIRNPQVLCVTSIKIKKQNIINSSQKSPAGPAALTVHPN